VLAARNLEQPEYPRDEGIFSKGESAMTATIVRPPSPARRACFARFMILLGIWIVVAGHAPSDLVVGALTAIAAGIVSLRLLPPGALHPRPFPMLVLVARFPFQVLLAGCDVAWRALSPRMPLELGCVTYQPQTRDGAERQAFLTLMSLLPGTLPTGTVAAADGDLRAQSIHCLDVSKPVAMQMAREETAFRAAFGGGQAHA